MAVNNTYIILSSKSWNESLANDLKNDFPNDDWILIDSKEDFNEENLQLINPNKIFIPHWSHIIPDIIFNYYECIIFHMTDLPYGRGGSPLQNLIVRGHKKTKISAIRAVEELDAGDIYLKSDLPLVGTAQEIYTRANIIIKKMINQIIIDQIRPVPQEGEIVSFKRRTPVMSDISKLTDISSIYDHIRMLDADDYPNAFVDLAKFRIEFSKASINSDGNIESYARIIKK